MKRTFSALFTLLLVFALAAPALAAESPQTCYPVSIARSEDGSEIRKIYELSPEEDPAGIPRSDFEQDGSHYTLTDLLRQEAPEHEERTHTETVTVSSKSKDMASVLKLLPQEREFTTEDGLTGMLTLRLETVKVEAAGYGSSTKEITAARTYPGLADQDAQYIPKSIEDNGRTLTLQTVNWQTENSGFFTAVATYSGTATSSYVTGYTVTAEYEGTVFRIALNKVRYVAIFEGTALTPTEPEPGPMPDPEPVPDPVTAHEPETPAFQFNWAYILIPLAALAVIGGGVGLALFLKRRSESEDESE